MDIEKVIKDNRQMKAVVGMSKEEFLGLIPSFSKAWLQEMKKINPDRKRKMGGGRKGFLPTMEHKLFAILLYIKTYPTFDLLGFLTNRERTRACRSTHFLLKVLKNALGKEIVLPDRKITSVEEFFKKFPEMKDVFLDGTERPVQRPKNGKKRKKLYSGKKKTTTRKSIIVSNEDKKILLLTPAKSGRRHDKRLADKAQLPNYIPKDVCIVADTGFQGIQHIHPNTLIPDKPTKHHSLTDKQKQNNRIISCFRIKVEHAIGGIKRMKAASDIYRNKLSNLDDTFMLISAGLWNYHLRQSA